MPARPGARTPINPNTTGRFLTIENVAAELNITTTQSYALLRAGTLPALKIGGRGMWRVERTVLEAWITDTYGITEAYVAANPMPRGNVWRDDWATPNLEEDAPAGDLEDVQAEKTDG